MANRNDTTKTTDGASPQHLIDLKNALREAGDQSDIGASWSNDRIAPLMQSILELTKVDGLTPADIRGRVALIAKLSMMGMIATDEMAADFEADARNVRAELKNLEGGA